jgi:type II secretory pathway pseudopilin PulG
MGHLRVSRTKGGFTLVEVLVSVVLLTMIGGTLSALVIHSIDGWSHGMSKNNADGAASVAVHKLTQDISLGSGATLVSGQLLVTMPPLVTDAYGEKYYDTNVPPTTYKYYLYNGAIYRKIGSETAKVFARDISAVTFSPAGKLVSFVVTGRSDITTVNGNIGVSKSPPQSSGSVVLKNFRG